MIGGPWSAMQAVLNATGWASSYDSYDGTIVGRDPNAATGIRIVGRSAAELIARITDHGRRMSSPATGSAELLGLRSVLEQVELERDGLRLQVEDLERRSGLVRGKVEPVPTNGAGHV